MEPTAEASLAAIRDRRRFGIAIAAMIRMMATTINNSMREKPFCRVRIAVVLLLGPESLVPPIGGPPWRHYAVRRDYGQRDEEPNLGLHFFRSFEEGRG